MFLLRCAFWLSVVYAAMFFGVPGSLRGHPAATVRGASAEAVAATRSTAAAAVAGLGALCGGREGQCLRDAADLTALVRTAIAAEPREGTASTEERLVAPTPVDAPLPPPDPRRRARLTR